MFFNYLSVAWRNFLKNRIQSVINCAGLAFGLASFLLITLYIFDELTYDKFYSYSDNIYRIIEHRTKPDGEQSKEGTVAYNIGVGSLSELPGVEKSARLLQLGRANIGNEALDKKIHGDLKIASKNFLEILDFPLLFGDHNTALENPYTVAITSEFAHFLFDTDDVEGKLINVDGWENQFQITAVIEKIPHNSSLQFDALFSEATLEANPDYLHEVQADWISNNFLTFFLVEEDAKVADLEDKLNNLVAGNRKSDDATGKFILQPISDMHFYSDEINNSFSQQGDVKYIYIFAAVALFILLIACINYMNLTTAYASLRAKEVGVRKSSGAGNNDLKMQFLSESFLITIISSILAILIVLLILPIFNNFTEKEITFNSLFDYRIAFVFVIVILFTSLISGTYPAFILSRVKTSLLLKNLKTSNYGSLELRKGLVIVQFVLSFVMISLTLAISSQINFVHKKDLGFDKDQLLVVDINSGKVRQDFQTIKNEYLKLADVKNVSVSSRVPGEWKNIPEVTTRSLESGQMTKMFYIGADENFLAAYNINLISGWNFSYDRTDDSLAVLLNESAAKFFEIESPSEQIIELPTSISGISGENSLENPQRVRVIGIVRDFNFQSLYQKVAPMIIGYRNNSLHSIDYFTVQLAGNEYHYILDKLEKVLLNVDPGHLLEYHFLDQQLDLFYKEDAKRYSIFKAAAAATIFIACLGLFGLAAFSAQQRTKEIGIRKVLGASELSIMSMLTKDFLQLIFLAIMIGIPIAWYIISRWLDSFAYKIEIHWWLFAGAGCLAILIAVITVSFQSFKAATSNVVNNLRLE